MKGSTLKVVLTVKGLTLIVVFSSERVNAYSGVLRWKVDAHSGV